MAKWTQADIDALRKKIALGASRGRYADRDVTFRPLDEMMNLLAEMENEVNGGNRRRIRAFRFITSKGF